MAHVVRKLHFHADQLNQKSLDKEWLVTNGLGGYSSLAINGSLLRKYHGLLVSALPAPLGRVILFNYVEDQLLFPTHKKIPLSQLDFYDSEKFFSNVPLASFRLENGLPIWTYSYEGVVLEKRVILEHMANTLHISYELLESPFPVELKFRPFFQLRHHEASPKLEEQVLHNKMSGQLFEIFGTGLPPLKITSNKELKFQLKDKQYNNVRYRFEEERGYDSSGTLQSPGFFIALLEIKKPLYFTASTEAVSVDAKTAFKLEEKRRAFLIERAAEKQPIFKSSPFATELLLAADQFVILPTRLGDVLKSKALGEEARTVIAGYHWFTDWGRDTMISLEGLLLLTGRFNEAEFVLRTYMNHLKDGLIPNMFPDQQNGGIYNTADATLWFFHALDRYIEMTQDKKLLHEFLPQLKMIIQSHINGTLYGIHVDPEDGLLMQGDANHALTWMDAVYDKFIVTPRRGKAVEINALWYNALMLGINWLKEAGVETEKLQQLAKLCKESFNRKFLFHEQGYLYDIVEGENGNDRACRPNQLFALSLKYPILKKTYWHQVVQTILNKLLTSYGLRTLSADHPDYKVAYQGNLFLRDSAYHQGTVWPFLIGHFIDAYLKVYPDQKKEARGFLTQFESALSEAGVGSISEIYDAERPFTHRGCIAQAWSVAEVLRSLIKVD